MIDLHIHVLPRVDDGPPDLDSAVALARAVSEGGVRTVAATSHVSDRYANTGPGLRDAAIELRRGLADEGVDVEVLAGAEIEILRLPQLAAGELAELRLGSGNHLLIEAPLSDAAGDFELLLEGLFRDGYGIVLAHPERCPAFQRAPGRVARLVARGALLSVTASSVSGQRGRRARELAMALLGDGLVHNISSDAHNLGGRAPGLLEPVLSARRELHGIERVLPWMTEDVPAAILAGEPVPPRPARVHLRRRGLLGRLRG